MPEIPMEFWLSDESHGHKIAKAKASVTASIEIQSAGLDFVIEGLRQEILSRMYGDIWTLAAELTPLLHDLRGSRFALEHSATLVKMQKIINKIGAYPND